MTIFEAMLANRIEAGQKYSPLDETSASDAAARRASTER
jgi:hypothetical protein